MSVASKNPFALLGDDDGPAPAPVAPTKDAAPTAPRRAIVGAGQTQQRGGRGGARGGARGGNAGAQRANAGAEDGEVQQQRDSRSERGGRGGRGEGRGGRGRGGPRGRGRAFDRHSQTDRVDSEKRVHQGWGGDEGKRELENEENAVADAAAEGQAPVPENAASGWDAPADPAVPGATPAADAPAPIPEEEVDTTKTLDEYLAERAAKKFTIGNASAPRQVEADESAFGTRFVREAVEEEAKKANPNYKPREKSAKTKQFLEIEQTFAPAAGSERGGRGRGRGGRGGDRGSERGGRGRGRGDGSRGAGRGRGGAGYTRGGGAGGAVNLQDQSAFPTLG
ncbi:hypothetical protein IE81DRAFT_348511 [Ceraceosorus guamensis]|uniref:Hyaluronan/mRNA-binding protein domain-containing protein n=1 Tax=Ceraceosorus guamensis TaxID=1522189 RepID=A0A316VUX7_9BASI|nr:hypothetical protein IE81DRAFT_348511 [Ceraceosorus guamensis]PWN41260.1 hypothetical protein IE81DRAFT_348511 [Ceraceosorus guamensis]